MATAASAAQHNHCSIPRNVAVIGGGLTGLTTAWYLSRLLPRGTLITLYEGSRRLGGWIESVQAPAKAAKPQPVLELGARVVEAQQTKPGWDDVVLLEMVHFLNLKTTKLLYTPRALQLRKFIYYPDHLVDMTPPKLDRRRVAASFLALWRWMAPEAGRGRLFWPRWRLVLAAIHFGKLLRNKGPWGIPQDMSMGDFAETLTGNRQLANNMLSALIHGVYGGDIWKLSAESGFMSRIFLRYWNGSAPDDYEWFRKEDLEMLVHVTQADPHLELALRGFAQTVSEKVAYMTFQGGFATLTQALAADLRKCGVTIRTGDRVQKLAYNAQTDQVLVKTASNAKAAPFDKVVSTLFAQDLASIAGQNTLPTLASSPAVTIQVVSLCYDDPNAKPAKYHGAFGYLIPSTVGRDKNPGQALGVLFDSDREACLRSYSPGPADQKEQPAQNYMSLTVMLGGRYWADKGPDFCLPEEEAIGLARQTVELHLGIASTAPLLHAHSKVCRNCIPQHTVGHFDRMTAAHAELLAAFGGRLAVAGASYQPPGVLTSLRAARDVACQISGFWNPATAWAQGPPYNESWARERTGSVGPTGLQRFLPETRNATIDAMPRSKMPFKFGNPPICIHAVGNDRIICRVDKFAKDDHDDDDGNAESSTTTIKGTTARPK